MSVRIPGSYINRTDSSDGIQSFNIASNIVDEDNLKEFYLNHTKSDRYKIQQGIISELESLVYLLTAYQLIKYCYSACLLGTFAHLSMQHLLNCKIITNSSSDSVRAINEMIDGLVRGRQEAAESGNTPGNHRVENARRRSEIKNDLIISFSKDACWVLYMKTIFCIFYHIAFIMFWLLPVADRGDLSLTQNGTWWFVSFLGESTFQGWDPKVPLWLKFIRLGMVELLLIDILILFIQLVIFQCIYKQSNIFFSHSKDDLGEDEIINVPGNYRLVDNYSKDEASSKYVLSVKIFELLSYEAFVKDN